MKYAMLLTATLLGACGVQTDAVYLRHPDGRLTHCGPYSTLAGQSEGAAVMERGCIEDYRAQGFVRVPKP